MKKIPTAKALVVVVGLIIIIFALYRFIWFRPAAKVIRVKQQEFQGKIHGPGTVQSKVPVAVSTKITGILEKLHADQGDKVTTGQLLGELDVAEVNARLEAFRAARHKAQQDVERAKASVVKAQANLSLAQSNYRRDLEVFNSGYISQAAFDITQAQLKVAESEHTETQKALTAFASALTQSAAEVKAAEASREYTRILAPMDGLITSRRAEIGDTVTPGVPVFNLVDLNQIWVAAWIDEAQIAQLKKGQHTVITLRSGRTFNGKVIRLNKEADTVTRELEVDVTFDKLPEPLVIGEEAEVFIFIEKQNAFIIPATAIISRDGKTGVMTITEGRAVFQEITLGAEDSGMVAVQQGLQDGELIIVQPGICEPGQKVKPDFQSTAGGKR
ncbi:MAG: efflux RND transporter periplasmic adaptor subunit [Proteobacteria bacterium]|nr:efflux RND transporter periplasmic adaptor subunit [Pseudomonadota bacterium]